MGKRSWIWECMAAGDCIGHSGYRFGDPYSASILEYKNCWLFLSFQQDITLIPASKQLIKLHNTQHSQIFSQCVYQLFSSQPSLPRPSRLLLPIFSLILRTSRAKIGSPQLPLSKFMIHSPSSSESKSESLKIKVRVVPLGNTGARKTIQRFVTTRAGSFLLVAKQRDVASLAERRTASEKMISYNGQVQYLAGGWLTRLY